jgi:hypothetical protein
MVHPVHNYSFLLAVAQIYPLTAASPEVLREVSLHLAVQWAHQEAAVPPGERCAARELFATNGARTFLETRGLGPLAHTLREGEDPIEPSILEFVFRECYPNLAYQYFDRVIESLVERVIGEWSRRRGLQRDIRHLPWELFERIVTEAISDSGAQFR